MPCRTNITSHRQHQGPCMPCHMHKPCANKQRTNHPSCRFAGSETLTCDARRSNLKEGSYTSHAPHTPHRSAQRAPHRTHRTTPHRTAPHRTTPHTSHHAATRRSTNAGPAKRIAWTLCLIDDGPALTTPSCQRWHFFLTPVLGTKMDPNFWPKVGAPTVGAPFFRVKTSRVVDIQRWVVLGASNN